MACPARRAIDALACGWLRIVRQALVCRAVPALHELMAVTRELRRLIQTGARADQLQHQALADGMRTLRQDGIDKVLAGVTSIGEVRATANG